MDTETDGELDAFGLLESLIQVSQGRDHPQPSTYRPLCVIFMGLGVAKIDEKPISEQLGDMPLVALNNGSTCRLIGTHHVTPVFRVELRCQLRRCHQVAEHHRELAT